MNQSPSTLRRAQQIIAEGLPIGPRLYPCVCGADRARHSGDARTGGCKDTGCRRYRLDTAYDLAYRALDAQSMRFNDALREADSIMRRQHYKANPRVEGEWSIGASDTGTCAKKIEYRNKPPEDFVAAPEDQREARAGSMLHEAITARMRLIFPWREFSGRIMIPGLDRKSEFDSYDPITCEVEDYKTAGEWKWDLIGDDGPPPDVWEQAMLYALALEDAGRTVRTVRISYFRRANGHAESFVEDYQPLVAKAALERLLGYATALDLGIELPRMGTGPSTDPLCRRCFARWHCWNVPAAERAGRSPESYTLLGAEPADETIVWAIGQRVEAAAATSAAKSAVDQAKALLDGVEPGRYGPYEGYEKNGASGYDWEEYAERLAEFYALPEEERPRIEDIPGPRKRTYTYIQWGKVRKATLQREAKEAAVLAKEQQAQPDRGEGTTGEPPPPD